MNQTHTPEIDSSALLPAVLPIFPLENAVLMPGSYLPLNIFEPRYLEMVRDALAGHRMIGMIQPRPASSGEPVAVYGTGCAGVISSHQETADGRIVLWLAGVCRYDVGEELPMRRRYREVRPVWKRFREDLESPFEMPPDERARILDLLRQYFDRKGLSTDWRELERLPDMQLIHALTGSLPLESAEKQRILESGRPRQRIESFTAALQFAILEGPDARLQ